MTRSASPHLTSNPMTGINHRNLRIGGAFLVAGQVFQSLLAFGVNLVLVRYILPEEFGHFALVLSGAYVVYSIISARVNFLIIRKPEIDYDDKAKDLYFSAMSFEAVLGTLILIIWLALYGNGGPWEYLLVGAVGLRHWTDLNKAFFERTMAYRELATLEAGASMGGHLLALTLALTGFGVIVLFVREAMVSVVNLFGLWRLGGLTIRPLRMLSFNEWVRLYKDARGIWLDGVLEGNFQRLTIILAGLFGGEAAAGAFFQGQRLAVVPHQFLSPIIQRLLANWFGRTESTQPRIAGRNRFLLFIAVPLLPAGLLTLLFADPVVPWLFGKNWTQAGDIVAAMCGVVAFFSLFETLKIYCLTTRQSLKIFSGRIVQYVGLLLPAGAGFAGWINTDIALAIGLSVAYSLAFLFLFTLLYFEENKKSRD